VWCLFIVWGKTDLYIARCKEEGGIQHRLKDGQLDFFLVVKGLRVVLKQKVRGTGERDR
jgi:hypothetical protein